MAGADRGVVELAGADLSGIDLLEPDRPLPDLASVDLVGGETQVAYDSAGIFGVTYLEEAASTTDASTTAFLPWCALAICN